MLVDHSYSSDSLVWLFSAWLSSPGRIGPFSTYIFITVFILQWNCCGAYCNYEELLQFLQNHDPFWICLQERILGCRFLPTLRGYISFTSTIRGPHGRDSAGILLRRSVPGSEVPLRTPLHAVVVRIHSLPDLCCLFPVSGSWCADCKGLFG